MALNPCSVKVEGIKTTDLSGSHSGNLKLLELTFFLGSTDGLFDRKITQLVVDMIDRMPIEMFVKHAFAHARIVAIISEWQLAPEKLLAMVVSNFRDIGLTIVHPAQEKIVFESVVRILKNSPEITSQVRKAAHDAKHRKTQSRHHAA